jgi:hypothetical protein
MLQRQVMAKHPFFDSFIDLSEKPKKVEAPIIETRPIETKPQEVVISYNEQQLVSVLDQIKLMNDRIDQLQQPEKKRGDVVATIQRDKNGKMQSIIIKESK